MTTVDSNREVALPVAFIIEPVIFQGLIVCLACWNRHFHTKAMTDIWDFKEICTIRRSNVKDLCFAIFLDRKVVHWKVVVLSLVRDESSGNVLVGSEQWNNVVSIGVVLSLTSAGRNSV